VRAAVQADNAASLAVARLLGMAPLGEGRIWCPARGRDEPCLWFEVTRTKAAGASAGFASGAV
jgi:RimJ/RimL family protein N-acetyltransferase